MEYFIKKKDPVIFTSRGLLMTTSPNTVGEDEFWNKMKELSDEAEARKQEIIDYLTEKSENLVSIGEFEFSIKK